MRRHTFTDVLDVVVGLMLHMFGVSFWESVR